MTALCRFFEPNDGSADVRAHYIFFHRLARTTRGSAFVVSSTFFTLTNRTYYRRFKNHDAAPSVVSAKIIRNKHTGYSEGYGFVEFSDRATAERALRSTNGAPMPGTNGRGFRLNWASFGVGAASRNGRATSFERHQQSVGTERTDRTNASERRSLRDGPNPNADETLPPTSEEASRASRASDASRDETGGLERVRPSHQTRSFRTNRTNPDKKKTFTESTARSLAICLPGERFALRRRSSRVASVRARASSPTRARGETKGSGSCGSRTSASATPRSWRCTARRRVPPDAALAAAGCLGDVVSGSASPAASRLDAERRVPERSGETDTDVVFQTEEERVRAASTRVLSSFDALSPGAAQAARQRRVRGRPRCQRARVGPVSCL